MNPDPSLSLVRPASARVPGRMDVLGGIADYSGSLLLQMPVRESLRVAIRWRTDRVLVVQSALDPGSGTFRIGWDELAGLPNDQTRSLILSKPNGSWAIYVAACFLLFMESGDLGLRGLPGAEVSITSEIPPGKGVASSAALEVATLMALFRAWGREPADLEIPLLAQKAENRIVGAPCGLMDQLAVYLGRRGRLLPLICQPARVYSSLPLPFGLRMAGIDSGVRHSVGGSSYTDVRTAAFMGYALVAEQEGTSPQDLVRARDLGDWSGLPYGGYLANISLSRFRSQMEAQLPVSLEGRVFLENFKGLSDPVTRPDPLKFYRVRACTAHPVEEQSRIQLFYELIRVREQGSDPQRSSVLLGEILFQSHASYSAVGLGDPQTDELVESVRREGSVQGVYGARVTGGGSGGTVCILYRGPKGLRTVHRIHRQFEARNGIRVHLFLGSSEGGYFRAMSPVQKAVP